jgi:hypothetical protein
MRFILIILVLITSSLFAIAQENVGIGTTTPQINSILDISSTDKGLLIPRMSAAERLAIGPIASAAGLLVYDVTDSNFWYWDGTQWVQVGSGIGTVGPTGPAGSAGANGNDGLDGAIGASGPAGADGADGADGLTGSTGADGATGPVGADGNDGVDGAIGPAGADGNDGIDGATGPAGADGNDGVEGATGPAGADGNDGIDGVDGATGPTGTDGVTGPQGSTGIAGLTGPTGPPGPDSYNVDFDVNPNGTIFVQDGDGTITTSSGAWLTGGNAGTTSSTNYIGTSDNQDLVVRTNAIERIRVEGNGDVGIGTNNPTAPLEVNGAIFGHYRMFSIHSFENSTFQNGTGILYFPANGDGADDGPVGGLNSVGNDYRRAWSAPFNGRLIKVIVRNGNDSNGGLDLQARITMDVDGTLLTTPSAFAMDGNSSSSMTMPTNFTFNEGQRIGVGFNFIDDASCPGNDCYVEDSQYFVTLVWEYEVFE